MLISLCGIATDLATEMPISAPLEASRIQISIDVISDDTLCTTGTTAKAAPARRATGRKQSPHR